MESFAFGGTNKIVGGDKIPGKSDRGTIKFDKKEFDVVVQIEDEVVLVSVSGPSGWSVKRSMRNCGPVQLSVFLFKNGHRVKLLRCTVEGGGELGRDGPLRHPKHREHALRRSKEDGEYLCRVCGTHTTNEDAPRFQCEGGCVWDVCFSCMAAAEPYHPLVLAAEAKHTAVHFDPTRCHEKIALSNGGQTALNEKTANACVALSGGWR